MEPKVHLGHRWVMFSKAFLTYWYRPIGHEVTSSLWKSESLHVNIRKLYFLLNLKYQLELNQNNSWLFQEITETSKSHICKYRLFLVRAFLPVVTLVKFMAENSSLCWGALMYSVLCLILSMAGKRNFQTGSQNNHLYLEVPNPHFSQNTTWSATLWINNVILAILLFYLTFFHQVTTFS